VPHMEMSMSTVSRPSFYSPTARIRLPSSFARSSTTIDFGIQENTIPFNNHRSNTCGD
jgi:hypothetical protein